MFFFFTVGSTTFTKVQNQYPNNGTIRCHNCGNFAASVVKFNEWFTFCFVPIIPLGFKGDVDVACPICNCRQPLKFREDVTNPGAAVPLQQYGSPAPQQYGSPPPQHYGSPAPNGPMVYK